jgi:CubicO group peptidase (beta-lactamase class C family)
MVDGVVAPGWEGVREAFEANFAEHGEVVAAVGVHHQGRLVVDLWGGTYRPDTLQLVFSTTKGWTAALASLLAQRGELDVDRPVAHYWPEFAAAGKGDIPVRWLLTHQAGLPFPSDACELDDVLGWDPVVAKLAASSPVWDPGTAHGYHAVTYGFLVGEVLRRVSGRSVGQLFADELAGPLGLHAWIGLPDDQHHRVEPLVGGLAPEVADESMRALLEQFMGPDTLLGKALSCHGALGERDVFNRPELWSAELPAANGIADARSISRLYAALIGDLPADGPFPAASRILDEEQLGRATTPHTSGQDKVLFFESVFGLGWMLSSPFAPFGGPRSFGHPGAGGSVGFADPEAGIGFGYVMSRMLQNLSGDPRSRGLIAAVYEAAGVVPTFV